MGRTFQGVCQYNDPPDWVGNVYPENGDVQASFKAAKEADQHIATHPGHRTIVMIGDDGQ
jgi:hypothetical protein